MKTSTVLLIVVGVLVLGGGVWYFVAKKKAQIAGQPGKQSFVTQTASKLESIIGKITGTVKDVTGLDNAGNDLRKAFGWGTDGKKSMAN